MRKAPISTASLFPHSFFTIKNILASTSTPRGILASLSYHVEVVSRKEKVEPPCVGGGIFRDAEKRKYYLVNAKRHQRQIIIFLLRRNIQDV